MKRTILILLGIVIILFLSIFVLYKNNQSSNEEVVEIFKEESVEKDIEEQESLSKEKVRVDIKGMVNNPGVYEVDSTLTVSDQTTPNMIQRIIGIFERKPLISKEI